MQWKTKCSGVKRKEKKSEETQAERVQRADKNKKHASKSEADIMSQKCEQLKAIKTKTTEMGLQLKIIKKI